MNQRKPWKTLGSRIVYRNPWLSVREDDVIRPDGRPGIYGVVEVRDSIAVVALNEAREIVLVGQWRYPHDKYTWEIPRGGSSEGENNPEAVARRELREEAGVEAAHWRRIGKVDVGNGIMDETQHLFLATELHVAENEPDAEEEIAIRWVPLTDAVQMVLRGEITEVCSCAAILIAERQQSDSHSDSYGIVVPSSSHSRGETP